MQNFVFVQKRETICHLQRIFMGISGYIMHIFNKGTENTFYRGETVSLYHTNTTCVYAQSCEKCRKNHIFPNAPSARKVSERSIIKYSVKKSEKALDKSV